MGYELDTKQKRAIEDAMDDAPVQVMSKELTKLATELDGLNIMIASTNREDLFDDTTVKCLRNAAESVGYNGSKMDKGNFPSRKKPSSFDDYDQEYFTLSIWFKHPSRR